MPPPLHPPPVHLVLHNPQIPQNTGTLARLCASQSIPLHVVGRPGFRLDDKAVKRAGLDYWPEVQLRQHRTLDDLRVALSPQPPTPPVRLILFTTKALRPYTSFEYQAGDCLVFGSETAGLPLEILQATPELCVTIPMPNPAIRSLNLAVSAAMALGEALRQLQPKGWEGSGDWERGQFFRSSANPIE